jgi:Natural resistance-associated macrophage protein
LRPVAGNFAFVPFALGIVGTGLLAVPVLAGSAAYAIGEAFKWPVGLSRKPRRATAFYLTLAATTGVGVAVTLSGLDPIKALYWSAVINGIVAVPIHDRDDVDDHEKRHHGQTGDQGLAAMARLVVDRHHGRLYRWYDPGITVTLRSAEVGCPFS